jgi:DNA/RNA-binding domain of Phe-tRNA-synthetase-like protein
MELQMDDRAVKLGIFVDTAVISGLGVRTSREEVFRALERELALEMKERFRSLDMVKDDNTARALRDFYWRIGIDPTKTRPSSEALLRRLLKKELPMINNLVDAGNLASTKHLVPIGIYDKEKISGSVALRMSEKGEHFSGIGNVRSVLEKGIPVLSDDDGIIHLYPYRDSVRTMITESCKEALVVSCGVRGMRTKTVARALESVLHYWDQLKE